MFGFDHPWFRPLSRRIATTVVCLLWFVMECIGQNPFWMLLSGGTLGATLWGLIWKYPKDGQSDD